MNDCRVFTEAERPEGLLARDDDAHKSQCRQAPGVGRADCGALVNTCHVARTYGSRGLWTIVYQIRVIP
jgi:hypothetical protein